MILFEYLCFPFKMKKFIANVIHNNTGGSEELLSLDFFFIQIQYSFIRHKNIKIVYTYIPKIKLRRIKYNICDSRVFKLGIGH